MNTQTHKYDNTTKRAIQLAKDILITTGDYFVGTWQTNTPDHQDWVLVEVAHQREGYNPPNFISIALHDDRGWRFKTGALPEYLTIVRWMELPQTD